MSPAYLRDLGLQRNQPEGREGLSRTRIPGRGHLGHSGGWKNTEGNHTHTSIHIPIKQAPQTRGLKRTWTKFPEHLSQRDRLQKPYDNHQRLESHQAVWTPGGEGKQDKGESSHYPSYRRTTDPDRAYSASFRLTRRRPNELSSGFTPFRNQQISGQESPFFTLPGGFQEKTRAQGKKQDLFSPKEERVRPNDPETLRIGGRCTQEPEVVVNHSIISSPLNRNITLTQIKNNAV
ncbi:hypothetical protein O181_094084 [Austropuccinia psidii MF-1]|uniref:Uncharacterized protein n=1 Tax=Austropuccinia psidii MF-1 TaxID=1389203 RepID=A0A9Q3J2H6_9BASI|nr:hypothetical protein [Austropuccinia psidii MF-1]